MVKSTFASFHYTRDHWRVQQVLKMGVIDGQAIMSPQDWESVKRKGKAAIENWIDSQMAYKSAVVVLVGKETASRPWVQYEIDKAWRGKKPLVGIRINGLKDSNQHTDIAGPNPFNIALSDGGLMSTYVPLYTPSGSDSQSVYADIAANLATWVASAYKRA